MTCDICGATLVKEYEDERGSFGPSACPNNGRADHETCDECKQYLSECECGEVEEHAS